LPPVGKLTTVLRFFSALRIRLVRWFLGKRDIFSVRNTETTGLDIICGPAQLIVIPYTIETSSPLGSLRKDRERVKGDTSDRGYLQISKYDYISDCSLREPLYALLLEAIDLEIVNINTLFHAGRIDDGKITGPLYTMMNDEPTIKANEIPPCVYVCVTGLIDVTTPITLKNSGPGSIFLSGINLSP
jgi:hypothetical protein